ncbi:hypothetical protein BDF19DRAFT_429033 [Syncephalis fuscata]|nr:hypothetical protein BDF19DRAFT_429033 [Syncephalis fuscata]
MTLLLKTLVPLLAIVGAVVGQTPNTNGTTSTLFKPSNISENCQKALNSSDVTLACAKPLKYSTSSASFKLVCDAPFDGAAGHVCADNQINKALDILESSCKDELEGNRVLAFSVYNSWLTYSLNVATACMKDTDGSYCVEKETSATDADLCRTCERSLVEATLKWNPNRSTSFAKKIIAERTESANDIAKQCDKILSGSSSSSAESSNRISSVTITGSVAFIIIGAMLFTL